MWVWRRIQIIFSKYVYKSVNIFLQLNQLRSLKQTLSYISQILKDNLAVLNYIAWKLLEILIGIGGKFIKKFDGDAQ